MKVGDYVRTKDGDLFILDDIVDNEVIPRYIHLPYAIWENEIIKSSPNIIDLIEVGDYVNGKLVEDIFNRTNYADKSIKLKGSGDYWYNEHIKSIVTKEQFSCMEYKIGE